MKNQNHLFSEWFGPVQGFLLSVALVYWLTRKRVYELLDTHLIVCLVVP